MVPAGEHISCAVTGNLLRQSKRWFGLHYSQKAWDKMLTTGSEGYPLTETELNVLGLIYNPPVSRVDKEFIGQHAGLVSQLVFLIYNDLRQFGFLEEANDGSVSLSRRGEIALDGVCRRLYESSFSPDYLIYHKLNAR